MSDKDDVIKGLEKCKRHECDDCTEKGASQAPWDCPVYDNFVDSALALLKEQEALPIVYRENQFTGLPVAHCPSCDECLLQFHAGAYGKETKFCYYCGQAVKWND